MNDDQRLQELIQADLDGRLDGADKAELARRLLADPSARRLQDELRRTDTLLRDLPSAEPPGDLRPAVQQALGLSNHNRGGRRVADGGVGFRLAAAVVAGLVVVGLGYGLLSERQDTTASVAVGATPVATLQAGSGQVVVRLEETGAEGTRLVLTLAGEVDGEIAAIPVDGAPSCHFVGEDPPPTASLGGESVLALSGGRAPAVIDCTGQGAIRLETRLDGTEQENATVVIGR